MASIQVPVVLPGKRSTEIPMVKAPRKSAVLICGSGRCLWDDISSLGPFDGDMMAVALAGMYLEKLPLHWVSLDPETFQWMLPMRPEIVYTPTGLFVRRVETHSHRPCAGVLHAWPLSVLKTTGGTSSLAACRIALALGYERVILAGVPIDGSGHFYDAPSALREATDDYSGFIEPWHDAVDEFKGRVRSLSGRTRELLGAPQ